LWPSDCRVDRPVNKARRTWAHRHRRPVGHLVCPLLIVSKHITRWLSPPRPNSRPHHMLENCASLYYTTTIYTPQYDKTFTVIRYIPPHVLPFGIRVRGIKTGKRYAPRRDPRGNSKQTRGPSPCTSSTRVKQRSQFDYIRIVSRYFFTHEEEVWYHGTDQESRQSLGCNSRVSDSKKNRIMAVMRGALRRQRSGEDNNLKPQKEEKSRFGGREFAARFAEQVVRSTAIRTQC
jgi:hypothetical protein